MFGILAQAETETKEVVKEIVEKAPALPVRLAESDAFIDQIYYGNSVKEWFLCMVTILAVVIAGKIAYRIFSMTIKSFTKKTKTKVDDMVLELVEGPVVGAALATGIWFATVKLTLSVGLDEVLSRAFIFVLTVMVAWFFTRLIEVFFQEYLVPLTEKSDNTLDDQILPIIRKGAKLIVWCMAIIIGLQNAGFEVTAILGTVGIGGIAIAMASKDLISNIFGGFTIFTDKPFVMNDRVKISGFDGTVTEIGVRSTRIKTLEGRTVTIPNSKFVATPVENVSLEPSRKVVVDLGLTYDTKPEDMEKALDIIKGIADSQSEIQDEPTIFFSGFGDFAMNIKFIYYINKGESIAMVQHATNLAILKQFNEAKLEFAFPTQTLYNIAQK